jgi:hypothetical protein
VTAGTSAASSATGRVLTNIIDERPVTEGVGTALVVGGLSGAVGASIGKSAS